MADGLFGLPISIASRWIFNSYVISPAGGDIVVVDPGLPTVTHRVLELIEKCAGALAGDVGTVVCTHGHSDHVGGVATLLQSCGAQVLLPERCRDYLAGEAPRVFPVLESSVRFMPVYREQPFSGEALKEFLAGARRVGYGGGNPMTLDFEPAGFVGDGDPLPGAAGWEAITAPGHTDDSTCFYNAETATLISGDAVVTQDDRAWFNPEYVSMDKTSDTMERLRSLEVRHLLPGHGHPLEATDVWARARRADQGPGGNSLLARCSRLFGRWPDQQLRGPDQRRAS